MHQLQLLEGLAEAAYDEAGIDPCMPDLDGVVHALLGPDAIHRGPRPLRGAATLIRVHDDWRIWVSRSLSPAYELHAIAHELGHWLVRREGLGTGDLREERMADYVGAAVIAPRAAFRAAYRTFGEDLPMLAERFGITETGAALRLGEVTGQPLAVVSPQQVRVRGGNGEWVWRDEHTVREWERRPIPGIRKVRLTDAPRRSMLKVDELAVG